MLKVVAYSLILVKARLAGWLEPRGLAFNEDKPGSFTSPKDSTSWGSTFAATQTASC